MSSIYDLVSEILDIAKRRLYLTAMSATEGSMSFKEWNAAMMLVGVAGIGAWLVYDLVSVGIGPGMAAVATKLLWAGAVMIGFNVVAAIGTAIVGSIATRKEFKDEAADERDKAVYARSLRNAYFVVSIGGLVTLFLMAFGYDPAIAAYSIFIAGTIAGGAGALSQLIYYRLG
jgi:hypothetical protein